jgi:hypothetical protein
VKAPRTLAAINGLLAERRQAGLCTDFELDEIDIKLIEDPAHGRFLRVEILFADGSVAGVDSTAAQELINGLLPDTQH